MSQLEIVTVGKIKSDWIGQGIDHYTKLLSKFRKPQFIALKEAPGKADTRESIEIESTRIAEGLDSSKYNIILDAGGRAFTSEAFARLLNQQETAGKSLRFHIGGAYGLSADTKSRADLLLSLSKFTFPHELCLAVLLEQLYRAYSILAGAKYHK